MAPSPDKSERFIETADGRVYVARESPDGSGWVVWTADYVHIVGSWPELGDARVDINLGINMIPHD